MNLEQAQIITQRYIDAIRLNLAADKLANIQTVMTVCLLRGETLTVKNILPKLRDPSLQSSIYRLEKKLTQAKLDDPEIESISDGGFTNHAFQQIFLENQNLFQNELSRTFSLQQKVLDKIVSENEIQLSELKNEYESQLSIANQTIESTQQELTSSLEFQKEVESKVILDSAQLDELKADYESDLQIKQLELEQANQKIQELETILHSKNDKFDSQKDKLEVQRLELQTQAEAIAELKPFKDKVSLVESIESLANEEIDFLNQKIGKLQAQVKSFLISPNIQSPGEQALVDTQEIERLKLSLEQKEADLNHWKAKATLSESETSSQNNLVQTLQSQLDTKEKLLSTMEDSLLKLKLSHQNELSQIEVLKQQSDVLHEETIASLQEQLRDAKTRAKNMVKELPVPSSKILSGNSPAELELESKIMDLRATNKSLSTDLDAALTALSRLQSREVS